MPTRLFCWWASWHGVRAQGHPPRAGFLSLEVPFGCACVRISPLPWPVGRLEVCGRFFSAATAEGERGVEEHSGFPTQFAVVSIRGKLQSMELGVVLRRRLLTLNLWEICPCGWVSPGPSLPAYQSQGVPTQLPTFIKGPGA